MPKSEFTVGVTSPVELTESQRSEIVEILKETIDFCIPDTCDSHVERVRPLDNDLASAAFIAAVRSAAAEHGVPAGKTLSCAEQAWAYLSLFGFSLVRHGQPITVAVFHRIPDEPKPQVQKLKVVGGIDHKE